jgi:O-antigen/teichoic acid export membrane protein
MLSTLIMAFLGFIFWMVNARLFTTEQVGLATTIISVTSLITSLSVLGLNTAIIRFLPRSERKNDKINTAFTLTALVTIVFSTLFLLLINDFSPKLLFIKENIIFAFAFIIFMVSGSLSSMIDSVFVAYRSTKFILVKNSLFSLLKIIFVFLFVSLGAYGIFASWMIAVIIASLMSFGILAVKFQYRMKIVFYDSIIKKIGGYSFANYLSGFIGGLPTLLLPLIIINNLSSETAAFYYVSMMIASLIFIIPSASSQSLFAEGSYDENNIKPQVRKAIKIILLLLIPAILITIFLGKYVLLLFGKAYSAEGFRFLQILAISGIFISINSVFASVWRIRKKMKQIIVRGAIGAVITLGLSYLFIQNGFGLLGVGYAWILGQIGVTLLYVIFLARDRK